MLETEIKKLTDAIIELNKTILTLQVNKTEPKTAQKEKKVSEPSEEKKELKKASNELTLDEIKTLAQKAVNDFDRETVKAIIHKYADKLVEIKPSDYEAFVADLKAL